MTAYSLLKFVHVAAVIIWVGGVIVLSVVNARLARALGGAAAGALAREQGFFGKAVMMPAALTTLVSGVALMGLLGRPSLWMMWGLAGVLGSIAIGASVLRSTGQELARLVAAGAEGARLEGLRRRAAVWGAVNIALLVSTVWAMVAKPTL